MSSVQSSCWGLETRTSPTVSGVRTKWQTLKDTCRILSRGRSELDERNGVLLLEFLRNGSVFTLPEFQRSKASLSVSNHEADCEYRLTPSGSPGLGIVIISLSFPRPVESRDAADDLLTCKQSASNGAWSTMPSQAPRRRRSMFARSSSATFPPLVVYSRIRWLLGRVPLPDGT